MKGKDNIKPMLPFDLLTKQLDLTSKAIAGTSLFILSMTKAIAMQRWERIPNPKPFATLI